MIAHLTQNSKNGLPWQFGTLLHRTPHRDVGCRTASALNLGHRSGYSIILTPIAKTAGERPDSDVRPRVEIEKGAGVDQFRDYSARETRGLNPEISKLS